MKTSNLKVRVKAFENCMALWEVSEMLGMHPSTLSNCMRNEWPEKLQDDVCDLIDDIYDGDAFVLGDQVKQTIRMTTSEKNERKQERRIIRLIDSVKETELRKEREREEWEIIHEKY